MEILKIFCEIVQKRSEENNKSIKLLYEHQLYGNCISILRQELDSMVRVLFLLAQPQEIRFHLIKQTLHNKNWRIGSEKIYDYELINHTANLYGWARNVYKFGCSFIHLSVFHYYSQQDPFNRLSKQELEIIKEFMMQYHNFPKNRDITFDTLQPYLLNIFEKINSNLKCSLENLAKNPIDTYVL